MNTPSSPLTDSFGRKHNYLRISLTERCNLRCSYCMPVDGVKLSPAEHLMNADEIFSIAQSFVKFGVTKIRLTGGEPLIRKDFPKILQTLSTLDVELSITSNAVSIDRHIELLKKTGVKAVNISLIKKSWNKLRPLIPKMKSFVFRMLLTIQQKITP